MSQLKVSNSAISGSENQLSAIFSSEVTLYLVDVSGSMAYSIPATDEIFETASIMLESSKIGALRDALTNFLFLRKSAVEKGAKDTFGVITFGGLDNDNDDTKNVKLIIDPERPNFEMAESKISAMRAEGGTPMGAGILIARNNFVRFSGDFFRIVLISDGQPSDSSSRVLEITKSCYEEFGIVIDTIFIGNPNAASEKRGADLLKTIATDCGGNYDEIITASSLKQLLADKESERYKLLGHGIMLLGDGSQNS